MRRNAKLNGLVGLLAVFMTTQVFAQNAQSTEGAGNAPRAEVEYGRTGRLSVAERVTRARRNTAEMEGILQHLQRLSEKARVDEDPFAPIIDEAVMPVGETEGVSGKAFYVLTSPNLGDSCWEFRERTRETVYGDEGRQVRQASGDLVIDGVDVGYYNERDFGLFGFLDGYSQYYFAAGESWIGFHILGSYVIALGVNIMPNPREWYTVRISGTPGCGDDDPELRRVGE